MKEFSNVRLIQEWFWKLRRLVGSFAAKRIYSTKIFLGELWNSFTLSLYIHLRINTSKWVIFTGFFLKQPVPSGLWFFFKRHEGNVTNSYNFLLTFWGPLSLMYMDFCNHCIFSAYLLTWQMVQKCLKNQISKALSIFWDRPMEIRRLSFRS